MRLKGTNSEDFRRGSHVCQAAGWFSGRWYILCCLWPGPFLSESQSLHLYRGDHATYLTGCWGDSETDQLPGLQKVLNPYWSLLPHLRGLLCTLVNHTCVHTHIYMHTGTPEYLLSTVKTPIVKRSQQEFWAQKASLTSWSNTHSLSHEKYVRLTPHSTMRDTPCIIWTAAQALPAVRHTRGPIWTAWSPPSLWAPGYPRSGLTSESHLPNWAARTAGSKIRCLPH